MGSKKLVCGQVAQAEVELHLRQSSSVDFYLSLSISAGQAPRAGKPAELPPAASQASCRDGERVQRAHLHAFVGKCPSSIFWFLHPRQSKNCRNITLCQRSPPGRRQERQERGQRMAVEDGAVARLLPADCLSIQEVGATGKGALGTAPGGWRRVWGWSARCLPALDGATCACH